MAPEGYCAVARDGQAAWQLFLGLPGGGEQYHYEVITDLWPLRSFLLGSSQLVAFSS